MSAINQAPLAINRGSELHSELLLLPDGRILVHNLTQTMAVILRELNSCEDIIRPRAEAGSEFQNAGSNAK